ncbi:MAG: hypothetical protein U1E76_15845 [Planctomycetota bacterium]
MEAIAISFVIGLLLSPGDHGATREWTTLEEFLDPSAYGQSSPALGVDDQGRRHVAYTGADPSCSPSNFCGVYYQSSLDGKAWGPAVRIPGSESAALFTMPEVEGTVGGRAYIAWFGSHGLTITWTDDVGQTFAPLVTPDPSAPGPSTYFAMHIDPDHQLHFAWASGTSFFYLHSVWPETHGATQASPGDPVFSKAERLVLEEGTTNWSPTVAVDQLGFVSLAWIRSDQTLGFTRTLRGQPFPPSITLDVAYSVQLSVSDEGVITLLYWKDTGPYLHIYTLVSFDGGSSFAGPFEQNPTDGGLHWRKCIRSGEHGTVYAMWFEKWKQKGSIAHLTYAESHDYGQHFPFKVLVYDNRNYPGASDVMLVATPEFRCAVEANYRYCESR